MKKAGNPVAVYWYVSGEQAVAEAYDCQGKPVPETLTKERFPKNNAFGARKKQWRAEYAQECGTELAHRLRIEPWAVFENDLEDEL